MHRDYPCARFWKDYVVTIHLTFCSNCAQNMPEFLDEIARLQQQYADDLCIIETGCMAACDAAPAVLLDDHYLPEVNLARLEELVREQLDCLVT
jgi:NADH:ubiquinone oxidoreductase subunit E